MPKGACAYSSIYLLYGRVSSYYHLGYLGNTCWTWSILDVSLYPFSANPVIRHPWSKRRTSKEYRNRSTHNSEIRREVGKMWIWHVRGLWKESNASLCIGRSNKLGSQKPGRHRTTPWMWKKESATAPEPRFFLLTILCFAFLFPHIVFWNPLVPWRSSGCGFVEDRN